MVRDGRILLLACAALCASCRSVAPPAPLAATSPAALSGAPPLPSLGCKRAPALRTQFDGERAIPRTLTSGGHTRSFLLVLPPPAASETPRPLVLNFPGLTESPGLHQLLSGMDSEARTRGIVLAYPEGIGHSWNAGSCCGRAAAEGLDDVQYARDLVAQLGRELCLDLRRVYATGMSNGAMLSWRLSCDASDLFAAVAPVAGVNVAPTCTPTRPVPVLDFHGTSDFIVTYDGGRFDLPSIESSIAAAETRNACTGDRKPVVTQGDATCSAKSCPQNATVTLCTIEGGGHTWPGGTQAPFLGKTSESVDATRTILDWFSLQSR